MVLSNVILIDGNGGFLLRNVVIVLVIDKIVYVGLKIGVFKVLMDVKIMDFFGLYIILGLIDMYVYID